MVKGEQNHRKTIDANGSRGKKPLYPIAPKKWPLFTSTPDVCFFCKGNNFENFETNSKFFKESQSFIKIRDI